MWLVVLQLLGGMVLLAGGGELLVRGASQLAAAARLSPLFIGLTVVAIGTSSPELVVSITTSLKGQEDLCLGNVVGSNVFNTLGILGVAAIFSPLLVKPQMVRFDVPYMIGASLLVPILALDGRVSRLEGCLLLGLLVLYTYLAYRNGVKETRTTEMVAHEIEVPRAPFTSAQLAMQVGFIVIGLVLLLVGCELFVGGAVAIARTFGMSEVVIGLTILAVGTSLPELVTSVVATIRNERDIAVGNVIGSNLFNVLGVLGAACVMSGNGIDVDATVFYRDLLIMVGTALLCLPIFATHGVITRWEGMILLSFYVLYTAYLVLSATEHPVAHPLAAFAVYVAIPMTVVFFVATVILAARGKKLTR